MTLQQLTQGLLGRGHYVSLVRPRQGYYDRPGCSNRPAQLLVRGIPVPGYRGLHIGVPAGRKLGQYWQHTRPDVIYIATEGPLGASACRQAQKLSIPTVSGFHTNFHNYSGHYHLRPMQRLILAYLRRLHNHTARTLVPSVDVQAELTTAGFENVALLERGVDCKLFDPLRRDSGLRANWGATPENPVALYVGRLAPEKNLDLFMRSCRAMRQQVPELRCVLVGDGPLYPRLRRENPDFVFCGMQKGKSLAAHYASADIFLFPSQSETFGNVTLEAMASGLAVLAYDYAAARRHVQDGVNGCLATLGDSDGFVRQAVELARQPARVEALRKLARDAALQISWEQVVSRFEGHLLEVIGQAAAIEMRHPNVI